MVAKPTSKLTYEVAVPNKEQRLKELIIYISDKCAATPTFCGTLLNKIIWASDFFSFQLRGKPITGEKYQRLERGPAPLRMVPIRREMETDRDIHIRKVDYHGRTQHRVVPLRNAKLELFGGDEISLVDEIIANLSKLNASEISAWSHTRAWQTRYDGDLIPYEAVYLSDDPVTVGDVSRTEELARKFNWHEYRT